MALNAVLVITDALFQVFFTDLRAGVLMAAVAGVGAVVVLNMALPAVIRMMPIKSKILVMLKGGWSPTFNSMTLCTITLDLLVQGIPRIAMATIALLTHLLRHEFMGELTDGLKGLYPLMVSVAGDTIILI